MNKWVYFILIILVLGLGIFFKGNLTGYFIEKEGNFCEDCNVLIILTDALRFDHLGCYGYEKNTSPNIDVLCEKGVVFENAISQATATRQSVTSLFVSDYVQNHQVTGKNNIILPEEAITIAEVLRSNEYKTAAFLRNFKVSREDILQGFDESTVFREKEGYLDENATIKTLDWLEKNKDDKFFVYLHYFAPHSPFNPPEEYLKKFQEKEYSGDINFSELRRARDFNSMNISQEDISELRYRYDAEVNYMDNEVGKVIMYLKENNLLDKTIIIFMADHGEGLAEKDNFVGHGPGINTVVQVPLVIIIPGEDYNRYEGIVELIDIGPTILDSLGIDIPKSFRGKAIPKEDNSRDFGFSNSKTGDIIRSQNYIFKRNSNPSKNPTLQENNSLFNIKEDPFELNNLNESNKKIYNEHLKAHENFLKSYNLF